MNDANGANADSQSLSADSLSADNLAAEPSEADFQAPSAPPNQSRKALISAVAAVTVLVMVAGFVAFAFAWGNDDPPSSGAESATADITVAAQQYVAAVNAGVASEYLSSVCPPMRAQLGEISDRGPADPQMAIRDVTDVTVDGTIASAIISIAPANSPDSPPRVNKLRFSSEDGWKFCGQYE